VSRGDKLRFGILSPCTSTCLATVVDPARGPIGPSDASGRRSSATSTSPSAESAPQGRGLLFVVQLTLPPDCGIPCCARSLIGHFLRIPRVLAAFRVHESSLSFAPSDENHARSRFTCCYRTSTANAFRSKSPVPRSGRSVMLTSSPVDFISAPDGPGRDLCMSVLHSDFTRPTSCHRETDVF